MKNFFKKLGVVILEIAAIGGILFVVAQKKGIHSLTQAVPVFKQAAHIETPFPALTDPTAKNFSWVYGGQKYQLNLTLYKSVYDYYGSQPKTYTYVGQLSPNWENDYYGMFLRQNDKDQTIAQLASSLQNLGVTHRLTKDQIVDMTMAFVQTIPYDDARAKEILAKDADTKMQYPYETLFRQAGVCSDKSLLAYVLLKQMGYGVSLFAYEQDNHMAIGIQCPKNYSTYGGGYCYAETTSVDNKIGIIPQLDATSNKTVSQLATISEGDIQQQNLSELGNVTQYQQTVGNEYGGIIQTIKVANEIKQLQGQITTQAKKLQVEKATIASEQNTLDGMKSQLEGMKNMHDYTDFNNLAKKYNDLLDEVKNDIRKYNSDVMLYNAAVERYNVLIKQ